MSSEMRMAPRPAKAPAWSHGLFPSPVDDPSSCSDNASDNSDKIDSYCQSQPQSGGSKNRKRKIIGNGAPSFVCTGGPVSESTNRGQQHEPSQKDPNEGRNSIGQGDYYR